MCIKKYLELSKIRFEYWEQVNLLKKSDVTSLLRN